MTKNDVSPIVAESIVEDRKPWTTPQVIVAELNDSEGAGLTGADATATTALGS